MVENQPDSSQFVLCMIPVLLSHELRVVLAWTENKSVASSKLRIEVYSCTQGRKSRGGRPPSPANFPSGLRPWLYLLLVSSVYVDYSVSVRKVICRNALIFAILYVNVSLTPTVAIWVQLQSILFQTGLSRHL